MQGLDSNPVEVCGHTTVTIDVGDGQRVSQELQVLASDYPILTLERDFYENFTIRLGDSRKETQANTRGGSAISRATVAHLMLQGDNSKV